jgi:ELWxxDGT repeat protein
MKQTLACLSLRRATLALGALIFVGALVATNTAGAQQVAYLLDDIRPGPEGSNPSVFAPLPNGSGLVFSANDGVHGSSLWFTDGTIGGAVMLADINPGPDGADFWWPTPTPDGSGVVFRSSDAMHGFEPWFTDGTSAGTIMLDDINPGPASSSSNLFTKLQDNSGFIFSADDGKHGSELWLSNGTVGGARLLLDLNPGIEHGGAEWITPLPNSDIILFQGVDIDHGLEMWRTNGTTEGTFLLHDINPGPAYSEAAYYTLLPNNSGVLFQADDGIHGGELWFTTGKEDEAYIVKDIVPGIDGSNPIFLTPFPAMNGIIFVAGETRGLWFSDGTEKGTRLLVDLHPEATDSQNDFGILPNNPNKFLFAAYDEQNFPQFRNTELWVFDGNNGNHSMLADINPGTGSSNPQMFMPLPDSTGVAFVAHIKGSYRLFFSDGEQIWGGNLVAAPMGGLNVIMGILPDNTGFVVSADDGIHGRELWGVKSAASFAPESNISRMVVR